MKQEQMIHGNKVYTEDRKTLFSDEDTWFETDRLSSDCTGLDTMILVQTLMEGRHHKEPYPLVRIDAGNRLIPVVVCADPHLVSGDPEGLDALSITIEEWQKIHRWIQMNREVLTDYWNGRISTIPFLNRLVKI